MTSNQDHSALRDQAVALRLAGKSLREVREALGPVGKDTLNEALRGTPPPAWTRRPNAKDDVRAQARELREQGMDYNTIAAQLGVSKSSVSLWVRDLPRPAHIDPEEHQRRVIAGQQRFRAREQAYRDESRAAAAQEIGALTDRELLISGAVAYWCEGTKSKPWRQSDRVVFMNSDPHLIRFFLRFVDAAGVERADLVYRVYIHESADVAAAQRFWEEATDAPTDQFRTPTLKRHNPKTVRKNVSEDYHGCLRVEVRRSGELYRRIEGWVSAITAATATN